MSSKPNTRMRLRLVPEDRKALNWLVERTAFTNRSRVIHAAVEFLDRLHGYARDRRRILGQDQPNRMQYEIPVPTGHSEPGGPRRLRRADATTIELKFRPEVETVLRKLVSRGVGPTRVAVVRVALAILHDVISRTLTGWEFVAQSRDSEDTITIWPPGLDELPLPAAVGFAAVEATGDLVTAMDPEAPAMIRPYRTVPNGCVVVEGVFNITTPQIFEETIKGWVR